MCTYPMLAKKMPLPSSNISLYADNSLFTPSMLHPLIPADDPSIGDSSLIPRPIPEFLPRVSKYSLYKEGQPKAPGVKMLNESAPPAKLML